MLFPSEDLCRTVESAWNRQFRRFVDTVLRHRPDVPLHVLTLPVQCDGRSPVFAIFAGVEHHFSRAVGLGLGVGLTSDLLDQVEEFFFANGDACRLDLTPFTDAASIALLAARGYRVMRFNNVYVRTLENVPGQHTERSTGVRVARISEENPDLRREVFNVIHRGFNNDVPPTTPVGKSMQQMVMVNEHMPNVSTFGAWVDDRPEPVGGGNLAIVDDIAILSGGSTLPPFRGRGVQSALIAERVREAPMRFQGGATPSLAIIGCAPGSPSERNIIRAGFQLLYTRPLVSRGPS